MRIAVRVWLIIALLASVTVAGAAAYLAWPKAPVRIGVLLQLSGPNELDFDEVLDWSVGRLNAAGGLGGHPVELVYRDTYGGDIEAIAAELAADPSVTVTIGPMTSEEAYRVAPHFIDAKKLLISPSATSADLFRMYAREGYFWRTCQSDIAQVRAIMDLLAGRGVRKVALVHEQSIYGKTFYDWAGFFATELDIDVTGFHAFEPGAVDTAVAEAVAEAPDYIIGVAFSEDAVRIKQKVDQLGSSARLFFTDGAENQYVVDRLGEGTELMTPAADPNSGFEERYREAFGYYPWDYLAYTQDALSLGLAALARQDYANRWWSRESLADSLRFAVSGRGEKVAWNETDKAIELLRRGEAPNLDGASGPLEFDAAYGMDPLETFYAHNVVETRDGVTDFWTQRKISSSESRSVGRMAAGASAGRTMASADHGVLVEEVSLVSYGERRDFWAVILASSVGWDNYRHQSDALAVYDLLKSRGVSDDRIILAVVDDVPWLKDNPLMGDVHHEPGGPNLRQGAAVDYSGQAVTAENLRHILLGEVTDETPTVLTGSVNSNVLVYLVDHGLEGQFPFHFGESLSASELADTVRQMAGAKQFRRLLMMVEACFGESLGEEIDTPGVLYLTGAAADEASYGSSYDYKIKQWLADDFTTQVLRKAKANPETSILDLYTAAYSTVIGSHARLLNQRNFGSLDAPIDEFISP